MSPVRTAGSELDSRQDVTVAAAVAAGAPPKLSALQRSSEPGESSCPGSDADSEWRAQTKHVFVLSNAGVASLAPKHEISSSFYFSHFFVLVSVVITE